MEALSATTAAEGHDTLLREAGERLKQLDNPESPLSSAGREEWSEKFGDLVDRIGNLEGVSDRMRKELEGLKAEVRSSIEEESSLPKAVVLRTALGKVAAWIDSKFDIAMKTAIETTIRTQLPPGN